MQAIRKNRTLQLLWLILAAHIFNFSVDLPDPQSDDVPEDLSINEMESVAEIILEKGFNIENAIPEHDEPDTNDGGAFDMKKEIRFFYENQLELPKLITTVPTAYFTYQSYVEPSYISVYPEVCPQPPEA